MIETLWIDSRDFRCILILPFTFLFLQFEWNASDWTFLDSFHQVSGETRNLVAETFWWDDSYFITDFLVGVEVESETGIELGLENGWERIGTFSIMTLEAFLTVRVRTRPWGGLAGWKKDEYHDVWIELMVVVFVDLSTIWAVISGCGKSSHELRDLNVGFAIKRVKIPPPKNVSQVCIRFKYNIIILRVP